MENFLAGIFGRTVARSSTFPKLRRRGFPGASKVGADSGGCPDTVGPKFPHAWGDVSQGGPDYRVRESITGIRHRICEEHYCDRVNSTARFGAVKPVLAA